MWNILLLILPILVPSWRFFKTIEPSPRVQWALLPGPNADATQWQVFRPKPQKITVVEMLRRLFWNPDGNENLFVMSCAERIQHDPAPQAIAHIRRRIQKDLRELTPAPSLPFYAFRLVFVRRQGDHLEEDIVFVSDPFPCPT